MPSSAVTVIVITFSPTASAIGPEGVSDTTETAFTVIVASLFSAIGVTDIDITSFATSTVYAVISSSKSGDSVPSDTCI